MQLSRRTIKESQKNDVTHFDNHRLRLIYMTAEPELRLADRAILQFTLEKIPQKWYIL